MCNDPRSAADLEKNIPGMIALVAAVGFAIVIGIVAGMIKRDSRTNDVRIKKDREAIIAPQEADPVANSLSFRR